MHATTGAGDAINHVHCLHVEQQAPRRASATGHERDASRVHQTLYARDAWPQQSASIHISGAMTFQVG